MSSRDLARAANLSAALCPADQDTAGPLEPKSEGRESYPSLIVAGAQAFLYVDATGTLNLSLHLDTGEVPAWLSRSGGTVPLRVAVGDSVIFEAT